MTRPSDSEATNLVINEKDAVYYLDDKVQTCRRYLTISKHCKCFIKFTINPSSFHHSTFKINETTPTPSASSCAVFQNTFRTIVIDLVSRRLAEFTADHHRTTGPPRATPTRCRHRPSNDAIFAVSSISLIHLREGCGRRGAGWSWSCWLVGRRYCAGQPYAHIEVVGAYLPTYWRYFGRAINAFSSHLRMPPPPPFPFPFFSCSRFVPFRYNFG